MHGDLGAHVQIHAAQEPELAQDQRTDHTMVVAIARDLHLILLVAIGTSNQHTVVHIIHMVVVHVVVDVIVRGAVANSNSRAC